MTRSQAVRASWIAGSTGLAGTAIASILAPAAFPHAWLAAVTTWLGWPLGCMGLLLIHSLTGGEWGHVIRPQLIGGMSTLLLLPALLIPLVLVLPQLYPWLRPEIAADLDNAFYLNLPAFCARGAAYLIIWFGLGLLIARALRQAETQLALARIAPAGLILLAISITFASIDTTMSLDPHFVSSVYGLITIAGMGLLALAVSVFAAATARPKSSKTFHDLGRLLLALVVLWAYLDFMQLLIVWQSDLPNEAQWYIVRSTGAWGFAAAAVAGAHFLMPFLVLLSPKVQQSRLGIGSVSLLLIAGAIINGWWLVIPASRQNLRAADVCAMAGISGIAVALALRVPQLPGMAEAVRRDV